MAKMERRFFPCEVKAYDDKELTVDHFISTETPDRSNDEINPDGMLLDGVPSVLKQHGQDPDVGSEPIARCLSLTPAVSDSGARGIRAKTKYYDGSHLTPPDNTGRRLYEKAKGGFMPYWSIGFIPLESTPKAHGGRKVNTWLCVEYSQVGVPDNVEAKGFNPAAEHAVLDGTPEHRVIDGIDIDARYASVFVKSLPSVNGKAPDDHLQQIRKYISDAPLRRNKGEGQHAGKVYDIIYQKQNDSWVRQAFAYPAETWDMKDAMKHYPEGLSFEPAIALPAAETKIITAPEQKSLTTSLEFDNEYRALNGAMQTLISEILYRSEPISGRDLRALIKEYSAYIEKHAVAMVSILAQMTEEQSQKCLADIMERKSVSAADPAPAGNGADKPPESTPPAAAPNNGGSSTAPPAAQQVAQGTEGEEGLVPEVDFDVVEGVAADSSQSNSETEATVEDTIEIDPGELKSIVRAACAEAVRASINKLRGRMD